MEEHVTLTIVDCLALDLFTGDLDLSKGMELLEELYLGLWNCSLSCLSVMFFRSLHVANKNERQGPLNFHLCYFRFENNFCAQLYLATGKFNRV